MTKRLLMTSVCLFAMLGSARGQSLEKPRPRQGYYLAGGATGVVEHARDDGDGLGVMGGFGFSFRIGQLLTSRFGLGLNIGTSSAQGNDGDLSVFGLGLAGQMVVAPNLAVHVGAGIGVISLQPDEEDAELNGSYGAAYHVGATYDLFPRPRRSGGWAITPGLFMRALPSDPVSSYAVLLSVEASYWSGLPKNQLELGLDEAFADN